MKSWGSHVVENDLLLVPLLCPFSFQPGFWPTKSRRGKAGEGCSVTFCGLAQSGWWKVYQKKTSRAAYQALNGRCGIQIGLWENIWCVRSRGLMMLFEFLLPWQISAGLLVALPNVSGRYVASQKRCSSYSLSVWGCVFQRWKYCPSQAPWLLQRQVLCTWTRGELCGLPRWPHCQWLTGQNSKGEQRCSGCCRCCCSGDLRGPMPQTPKCQQNCCEPSLCRRSAGYLGIGSHLRDAFCAKLFGKI